MLKRILLVGMLVPLTTSSKPPAEIIIQPAPVKLALQSELPVVDPFPTALAPINIPVMHPEDRFTIFADWAYSETLPDPRPADIVLDQLKDIPLGSPKEEIQRVADAFGMGFRYMTAVAQIESDFEPHNCTGKYCGLYQLSQYEFKRFGPTNGDIFNPRHNAIAAAYKMQIEEAEVKINTRQVPTISEMYLIHQQGTQGAARHIEAPADQSAWRSMCQTDEGHQKGEAWCKKAIWGNTLPAVKSVWKTVDAITSGAFVTMWQQQVASFLSGAHAPDAWRYAVVIVHHKEAKHRGKHDNIAKHDKKTKYAAHHHKHHG